MMVETIMVKQECQIMEALIQKISMHIPMIMLEFGNTVMNESVWLNFVAPNSGRVFFETDYQSALYGESIALIWI